MSLVFNPQTSASSTYATLPYVNTTFLKHQYPSINTPLTVLNGGDIVLNENDNNSAVTLKAPATGLTSYNFTYPNSSGTNGEILQTNGSGTCSWTNNPSVSTLALTNAGVVSPQILFTNASGGLTTLSNATTGPFSTFFNLPSSTGSSGDLLLATDGIGNTSWSTTIPSLTVSGNVAVDGSLSAGGVLIPATGPTTTGQYLTYNGSNAVWAKPTSNSAIHVGVTTNSTTTYASSGLTVTITPTFTTSKISIRSSFNLACANLQYSAVATLARSIGGGTTIDLATGIAIANISNGFVAVGCGLGGGQPLLSGTGIVYLDSPNTTSAVTYTVYFASIGATFPASFGYQGLSGSYTGTNTSSIVVEEIF
jgi:hypothetical protein